MFKRISSTVSPPLPPVEGTGFVATNVNNEVAVLEGFTAVIPAVDIICVISPAGKLASTPPPTVY